MLTGAIVAEGNLIDGRLNTKGAKASVDGHEDKPRVYLVHQPSMWDYAGRTLKPLDISRAAEYGELVLIFPGLGRPPKAEAALPIMAEKLAEFSR